MKRKKMKMKKSRNIVAFIFKIIGVILICSSLGLSIYNIVEDQQAKESSKEILDEVEENIVEPDNFIEGVPDYVSSPDKAMPTTKVDNTKYIGVLTMNSIGIKLPVQEEWNFNKLRKSPARYKGSAYLNNLIIAAHSYRSQFGKINNLKIGDKVQFKDMEGNLFEYEVTSKETIHENDSSKLEEGNWDLTLFTCSLNTQYRVIVRLRKISTY